ncbi:MAG: hypothetical protein JNN30_21675 [Rhodanobacteraceae bacterium]|nr:hypothetical protein [Rhodanobacteraceae bacterium]
MEGATVFAASLRNGLSRLIVGVMAWVAVAGSCFAGSNPIGLAFDPGFGTAGFSTIPLQPVADAGSSAVPIGVIHLAVGGGYVLASLQRVSSVYRIVLTRYTEAGMLDTSWGVNGSQMPALPSPHVDFGFISGNETNTMRLVAGSENGQDIFYLAFSLRQGVDDFSVAVAKFVASGAFDSSFGFGGYAVSKLPNSAPGGLDRLRGAAFTLVFGLPVLVVVVEAPGNRLVFSRAHGAGSAALSDQGGGSSVLFSSSLTITQVRTNGPNHIELVGRLGTEALYADYDAGTLALNYRTTVFPCPFSTAGSVIDAIERPAGWNGDVLVAARADCPTVGIVSLVARIAAVATAPNMVWYASTGTNDASCTIATTPLPCLPAMLAYSANYPGVAITRTPNSRLVPVDVINGRAMEATPFSALSVDGSIVPNFSSYRGTLFRYPRLVGFGQLAGSGTAQYGIAGLFVDGLFINGFN